jgi:hypothetical protein
VAAVTTLLLGACASTAPSSSASAGAVQVDVPAIAHPAGETPQWWYRSGAARAAANGAMAGKAKNVILFLGDGMSLERYRAEGHVQISFGTGQKLLEAGLARAGIERRIMLELPAFLGLGMIIGTTDLLGTLPRHIGQTLADMHGLQVHDCPFEVEGFSVKQHWHARYHQDNGNRWLREVVRGLFQ